MLFVVRAEAAGRTIRARSREISDRLNAMVTKLGPGSERPLLQTVSADNRSLVLVDWHDGAGVQLLTVVYPEDAAIAVERGEVPDTVPQIAESWRTAIERALGEWLGASTATL